MTDVALQPGLRGLELFDAVPPGPFAMLVRDDRYAPHLKPGEMAIVDTTNKERMVGELYVITLDGIREGWSLLRIVEMIKGFAGDCTMGVYYAFGFKRDIDVGDGHQCCYVDGPLGFQHWPNKCRGRVVGVMVPK